MTYQTFRLTAAAGLLSLAATHPLTAADPSVPDGHNSSVKLEDPSQASADTHAAVEKVKTAMMAWLKLLDEGDYEKSWDEAGPLLQSAQNKEKWVNQMKYTFAMVGKLEGRKFQTGKLEDVVELSDGTDVRGEYVTAYFSADYSKAGQALETVTFQKIAKGDWKPAGFYVTPHKPLEVKGLNVKADVDVDAKVDGNVKASPGTTDLDATNSQPPVEAAKKQPPADAESDADADVIPEDKENTPAVPGAAP